MEVIILLIAISLVLALAFLGIFILAVRRGQFEDEYTPAVRMLFDNETEVDETSKEVKQKKNKK